MPERPRWGVGSNQHRKRPGTARQTDPESSVSLSPEDAGPVLFYDYDLGTAEARDSLLDVLSALEAHRGALVVVGAQAVYERTKDLADVTPTATTDGDIGVDPTLVAEQPLIGEAMSAAGFFPARTERPGIYSRTRTGPDGRPVPPTIDLIAPEALAGSGTRGARMGPHGKNVVGRAAGIEMSMIDRTPMMLGPLHASGRLPVEINVAGYGALLCAKSWKLAERLSAADAGRPNRVRAKDAADAWRLMASSDPHAVGRSFALAERHPRFGEASRMGYHYMLDLFGHGGRGIDLAVVALADVLDEDRVAGEVERWIREIAR